MRACLYWFQDEDEYRTQVSKTAAMPVHSDEFQNIFSQFCKGIIELTTGSVVSASEEHAIVNLDVHDNGIKQWLQSTKFPATKGTENADFFIAARSRSTYIFLKFCAESFVQRENWIFNIRRLLATVQLHDDSLAANRRSKSVEIQKTSPRRQSLSNIERFVSFSFPRRAAEDKNRKLHDKPEILSL